MYQDESKPLTVPPTELISTRSRIFPGRDGELLKAQLVSFQVWPNDFELVWISSETIIATIFISGRGEGSYRHPIKFFSIRRRQGWELLRPGLCQGGRDRGRRLWQSFQGAKQGIGNTANCCHVQLLIFTHTRNQVDQNVYAVKIARERYRGPTDRARKLEEVWCEGILKTFLFI